MSNKMLVYDKALRLFFEKMHENASSEEQCMNQIKEALCYIAEKTSLGKCELHIVAPASRFREIDINKKYVIYQKEEDSVAEKEVIRLDTDLVDGGAVTIYIYPRAGEYFESEEKDFFQFIAREVFLKCNRTEMRQMLATALNVDMATGVANQDAFVSFYTYLCKINLSTQYQGIFFNIHNFKYVNKVFGFSEGDIILKKYARQVAGYLEKDEMLARIGGDNFVALVKRENSERFINQIQNLKLFHQKGFVHKCFFLGATVGLADLKNITHPRDIISQTGIAYQVARKRGTGSVVKYTSEIQQELMQQQEIVSSFDIAIANMEFLVYFQPKVEIATGKMCGAEALVRWLKNDTILPPGIFIGVLEKEGSVCHLDYYVLEQTCDFLKNRKEKAQPLLPISVNFSRRHLQEDNFVDSIVEIIDSYGIEHKYIEVELTESDDMQEYSLLSKAVAKFKKNGIRTSIDDFGTGYSSLKMLRKVDLDVIKIDNSFIPSGEDYAEKEMDVLVMNGLVNLAHQLKKEIVAEGVETKSQLEYLREVGCDYAQGFLFDPPLTPADFSKKIHKIY